MVNIKRTLQSEEVPFVDM